MSPSAAARLCPPVDEAIERASPELRTRTEVECIDAREVRAHLEAWSDLATRALEPNVFLEPVFMIALTDALCEAARPRFLLAWDADAEPRTRLAAVLPLRAVRRRGARIARGFRHELTTLGTPLLDRERGVEAFEDMLGWLAATRPATWALAIGDVPAEGLFWSAVTEAGLPATTVLAARVRAVLLAGRPVGASNRRIKELARLRRRLAERGRLAFASATSTPAVAEGIERFLELEASGWKGRRGSALACNPDRKSFARAMATGMAARGACRIDALLLDDAPIAMGIVLRSGAHAAFWKTAFDESVAFASPGVQLALELTRVQERDRSLALTDSCAISGHPMIDGMWSGRRRIVDVLIATSPSIGPRRFALAVRLELFRTGLRALAKRTFGAGRAALRTLPIFVASRRRVERPEARRKNDADQKETKP